MSYLAEQNIVGSLLMDNESMSQIYNILEPQMFTSELLGRIYHEFQRGYDNRYEVNLVVLEQKLRSDNYPSQLLNEVVKECFNNTVTSATIKTNADIVVSDYKACRLDKFLSSIKVSPNNFNEQIRAITEEIEVLQGDRQTKSKTLAEIAKENKGKYFCEREVKPLYMGLPKLDDLLGGLEGGDVIIVAARPGVGKSAFATQITSNLANQGKKIGYYNLEMQDKQVYERFIASESGIGLTRIRRAIKFLGDEQERFDRANEKLEQADNIIITTGAKSPNEIHNEIKHMDYDIIIVDYLQLLKSDASYRGNRYAEVGAISKAIKGLAMELKIPFIVLSQLNRVSEGKETKEPTMSELRESGDLEQDASVIIMLWDLDSDDRSRKGCKVDKNRQGETGKYAMRFNGDLMRFEEINGDTRRANDWESMSDDCPFE